MFVTNVLLKKAKSKYVMVLLRSTVSEHCMVSFRERIEDKKEIIHRDPWVDMDCVYKEEKKLKSVRRNINISKQYNEHTYGTVLE